MAEELIGNIEQVVFSNEESGFTVAYLNKMLGKERICIVGPFSEVHAGEMIHCQGNWIHHPSYGKQFSVENYTLKAPEDITGIQRYLESGLVKGIGPAYAKKIVDHFGKDTLTIIDTSPSKLLEIEGMGKKRVEKIISCWSDQKQVRKVMVFLRSHGVSLSLAQKIYKRYGDESIEMLMNNPYELARQIKGVGFKTADQIAKSLGIEPTAKERLLCGIEYVLLSMSEEGHTCYPQEKFITLCAQLLQVEESLIAPLMEELLYEDKIRIEEHLLEETLTKFVWAKGMFLLEVGIAHEIKRLKNAPQALRSVDEDKAILWAEEKLRLQFAFEQQEAIRRSLKEKFHIITGGPGTGKSTITQAILKITDKLSSNILLAAPTGKAAKRLSEITKRKAHTIHSLLEFDFTQKSFKKNASNPLSCDLIIIDEASMIDTYLMQSLLRAIPDRSRVILIGDIDQLPSVGAGNVLKDIIQSEKVCTTQLQQIFRQAKGSRIITNAHRVNQGKFPDLKSEKGSDFLFFDGKTPEEILMKLTSLVSKELPKSFRLNPIFDIQVLCPMKKGIVGTENINEELQKILNKETTSIQSMGRRFKLKDKVMQIRNNYDKQVFNGDVGIISEIDEEEGFVLIDFDGLLVEYDKLELEEVVLAYAVSIHKYQGSECPCIVIPIHTSHFKLLYKNLLYTGITRGKKLVVLIGSTKAIAIAINNDDVKKRYTGLKWQIEELLV